MGFRCRDATAIVRTQISDSRSLHKTYDLVARDFVFFTHFYSCKHLVKGYWHNFTGETL